MARVSYWTPQELGWPFLCVMNGPSGLLGPFHVTTGMARCIPRFTSGAHMLLHKESNHFTVLLSRQSDLPPMASNKS